MRDAVGPYVLRAADLHIVWHLPLSIIRHVQVEVAIVVVVEEGAARGPVGTADTRNLADVLERAVAIIEIQHIHAVIAEEDVLVAVVVDVADHDAVAVARESKARRFGHFLKAVAAQVLVEPIGPIPAVPSGRSVPVAK